MPLAGDFCETAFVSAWVGTLHLESQESRINSPGQASTPHGPVSLESVGAWSTCLHKEPGAKNRTQPPDVYAGALVTRAVDKGPEHCQHPDSSVRATVMQGAAASLGTPPLPKPCSERRAQPCKLATSTPKLIH